MDSERFDSITRALVSEGSRRGFLRGLGGAAAAALALRSGRDAAAAPNRCAVACSDLKGPQKAACGQACRECDGDFNRVCIGYGPFGPASFACCAEGDFCSFDTGQCLTPATCPSGDLAENCLAGIESSCEDGACAQAVDVDGGCACVERACSFEPCSTGAECESGLCVDIPGCCGDTQPFCGIPCGTLGITAQSGW